MFDAIVFAVLQCGFIPRCALEVTNSGQVRIQKIQNIIEACMLGIHDISNTELDIEHGLPRFNMPLALGLFLGCAHYGGRLQRKKTCLIFDVEQYRYQKFISDIGGQDIASHQGDTDKVIEKIRDWLQSYTTATAFPGGATICEAYARFRRVLPEICQDLQLQEGSLTFRDLSNTILVYSSVLTTPPAR